MTDNTIQINPLRKMKLPNPIKVELGVDDAKDWPIPDPDDMDPGFPPEDI